MGGAWQEGKLMTYEVLNMRGNAATGDGDGRGTHTAVRSEMGK